MKIRVAKLGTECRDKASQLNGTLTHWVLDMGQHVDYLLQPKGLSKEGQPLPKIILELARLEIGDDAFEEVDVPFEVLGTIVTNSPSGFTGMAVQFVRHVNGCFHVAIQPAGILEETKQPIRKAEFDLRECTGDMIVKLSEGELAKSKHDTPSPASADHEDKFVETGSHNRM